MEDASRHKRSKIEPLTPATVLSTRSAKSSGYATIQFEINAAENKKICVAELGSQVIIKKSNLETSFICFLVLIIAMILFGLRFLH